ncbi:hypothetical protein QBC33DRAFT_519540 [Phialemonium atrogriseum]|uniref:Uncharacterized protein n=1 Tax=Phialemonium atrogriseum TaxID=1093897 RepID=A0AAJ0BST9_9PEZI|nr:uncharacterized protein QBC33DRAFT_519540 [Phialemonium atrogriseum]KAK1762454.1 hypothetical protein QBC33DRAFT_519540 [Phialemonium atrogriseum]
MTKRGGTANLSLFQRIQRIARFGGGHLPLENKANSIVFPKPVFGPANPHPHPRHHRDRDRLARRPPRRRYYPGSKELTVLAKVMNIAVAALERKEWEAIRRRIVSSLEHLLDRLVSDSIAQKSFGVDRRCACIVWSDEVREACIPEGWLGDLAAKVNDGAVRGSQNAPDAAAGGAGPISNPMPETSLGPLSVPSPGPLALPIPRPLLQQRRQQPWPVPRGQHRVWYPKRR